MKRAFVAKTDTGYAVFAVFDPHLVPVPIYKKNKGEVPAGNGTPKQLCMVYLRGLIATGEWEA
jgi:hypothetical protein